jgi:hypothetical protein
VNPLAELQASFRGWGDIFAGRPDAASRFNTTAGGIAVAIGWFVLIVLLSAALQSLTSSVPSFTQLAFALVVQGVTLGMIWLAVTQTFKYLKIDVRPGDVLVPIIYGMAFMFLVAIPLTLLGSLAPMLAVLGLAVAIFFAGKTLAGMTNGTAAALAALCLIVLVVVPNALYIGFFQLPFSS